jgi:hypothetical protein
VRGARGSHVNRQKEGGAQWLGPASPSATRQAQDLRCVDGRPLVDGIERHGLGAASAVHVPVSWRATYEQWKRDVPVYRGLAAAMFRLPEAMTTGGCPHNHTRL